MKGVDFLPRILGSVIIIFNVPTTLSPVKAGDAHNWWVFLAYAMHYSKTAEDQLGLGTLIRTTFLPASSTAD
jgi:hypothetical protein